MAATAFCISFPTLASIHLDGTDPPPPRPPPGMNHLVIPSRSRHDLDARERELFVFFFFWFGRGGGSADLTVLWGHFEIQGDTTDSSIHSVGAADRRLGTGGERRRRHRIRKLLKQGGGSRRRGDVVDRGSSPIMVRAASKAGERADHVGLATPAAPTADAAEEDEPGVELSDLRKQWLNIHDRFNRRMGPAGMATAPPPAKATRDHGWRTERHPENAVEGVDKYADADADMAGGDADSPMRLRGYLPPNAGQGCARLARRQGGAADVARPPELEPRPPHSAAPGERILQQAIVERFGWAFPLRTVVVAVRRHGPGDDIGLQVQGGISAPIAAGDGNLYVTGITAMSPAAQTQQIGVGDRLVDIDGVSLVGADRAALHLALARNTSGTVTITVLRPNAKAVRAAAAPAGPFPAGLRDRRRSDSQITPDIEETASAAKAVAVPVPDHQHQLSERAIGAMLRDMDGHLGHLCNNPKAQAQVMGVRASIDVDATAFGEVVGTNGGPPADKNWKVTQLHRPPSPRQLPPPSQIASRPHARVAGAGAVTPTGTVAGNDDVADADAAVHRLVGRDRMGAPRPGSVKTRHAGCQGLSESLQLQLETVEADIRAPSASALRVQLARDRPSTLELQLAQTAMQFTALEEEMAGLSFSDT